VGLRQARTLAGGKYALTHFSAVRSVGCISGLVEDHDGDPEDVRSINHEPNDRAVLAHDHDSP
jgi:hypothetical protein